MVYNNQKENSMYLRNVDERTLGTCCYHRLYIVGFLQGVLRTATSCISGSIEHFVHLVLERLEESSSRLTLQVSLLGLLNELFHLNLIES